MSQDIHDFSTVLARLEQLEWRNDRLERQTHLMKFGALSIMLVCTLIICSGAALDGVLTAERFLLSNPLPTKKPTIRIQNHNGPNPEILFLDDFNRERLQLGVGADNEKTSHSFIRLKDSKERDIISLEVDQDGTPSITVRNKKGEYMELVH